MYIEKRKVNGKIKYYLGHSFREDSKIHKIRKFLGFNLSSQLLEERKKKASELILQEIHQYKIIEDPLKTALNEKDIEFVKKLENKENLKVFHLSEQQWQVFSELFTYNTNAIEGSKLREEEVVEILEKDKWPEKKSKEDIAEAYGVDEAISFIRKTKEHISLDLIKQLHKIVFRNSKHFAGEFRKPGEEVVVMSSLGHVVHHGAPQSQIVSLLKELIEWYNSSKTKYPSLILAVVVHNQFENIHPFRDGNGRVGRLLLNNILIKNSLPPINIEFDCRRDYYATLQEYENNHNIKPTINFLIKEYKEMKKQFEK